MLRGTFEQAVMHHSALRWLQDALVFKIKLFRLVDEDNMMRVNACTMQIHWKGPLWKLFAPG